LETLKGRDRLENLVVDLKGNWDRRYGLDAYDLEQGPVAGSYEHGNEPSGSIKGGEFLDWLNDYYLLNKDSTPWS
jgi:hypothetical protein